MTAIKESIMRMIAGRKKGWTFICHDCGSVISGVNALPSPEVDKHTEECVFKRKLREYNKKMTKKSLCQQT